jgi:P-type Cu2+ transporter
VVDGDVWRLGRRSWAVPDQATGTETVLSRNGAVVFDFSIQESARPGTVAEIERLARMGYQLAVLSGDTKERVRRFAERMGLSADRALGGLSPADKAAQVAACRSGESLFLGDGVNDSLAFDEAAVAGTVAIDRPALPAKAHFFLLGEGLAPLREALTEARRLALVSRRVLFISTSYNVLAIAVSLAGWMSPLKAALSMPLSSVGILALTLWQLRQRNSQTTLPALQTVEALP